MSARSCTIDIFLNITNRKISRQMNMNERMVSAIKARARKRLQGILAEENYRCSNPANVNLRETDAPADRLFLKDIHASVEAAVAAEI